jgi:hypothetical protein
MPYVGWDLFQIKGSFLTRLTDHVISSDVPPIIIPPPPPPPPPPPQGDGVLINGDFESGWYHPGGVAELQIPNDWVFWFATQEDENPIDANEWSKFVRPEVRVLSKDYLPPEEWSQFIVDGNQTVKVFKGSGSIYFSFVQGINNLSAGQYALRLPVFADLVKDYTENGEKIWANDPNGMDGRIRITDNGETLLDWYTLTPGIMNTILTSFSAIEGSSHTLAVEIMAPYALKNNGFFIDGWTLTKTDVVPSPSSFEQEAWDTTSRMQQNGQNGIRLNKYAGLQQEISMDNFGWGDYDYQIVTSEAVVQGKTVQAAESLSGNYPRRVYVWEEGQEIYYFEDPRQ